MAPKDSSRGLRKGRPRGYRFDVWVSEEERAEITERAACAGLSHSSFLRSLALNLPVVSVIDKAAVEQLLRVNGDLGRVAGLLKLWLATKRGEGANPLDVDALMTEFRGLQKELKLLIGSLAYDR